MIRIDALLYNALLFVGLLLFVCGVLFPLAYAATEAGHPFIPARLYHWPPPAAVQRRRLLAAQTETTTLERSGRLSVPDNIS